MRENPLVCVEMDELTSHGQWATLIVFGKYEELPNTAEHQAARDVAEKLFQQHPMWWQPASVPVGSATQRMPIVFRIAVDQVTGRYARPAARVKSSSRPSSLPGAVAAPWSCRTRPGGAATVDWRRVTVWWFRGCRLAVATRRIVRLDPGSILRSPRRWMKLAAGEWLL